MHLTVDDGEGAEQAPPGGRTHPVRQEESDAAQFAGHLLLGHRHRRAERPGTVAEVVAEQRTDDDALAEDHHLPVHVDVSALLPPVGRREGAVDHGPGVVAHLTRADGRLDQAALAAPVGARTAYDALAGDPLERPADLQEAVGVLPGGEELGDVLRMGEEQAAPRPQGPCHGVPVLVPQPGHEGERVLAEGGQVPGPRQAARAGDGAERDGLHGHGSSERGAGAGPGGLSPPGPPGVRSHCPRSQIAACCRLTSSTRSAGRKLRKRPQSSSATRTKSSTISSGSFWLSPVILP